MLRLQRPGGDPYLHMIEWQGWNDNVLLWRTLSYLGWLGQNRKERPILVTIVYLKPNDDVGDTLDQQVEGTEGWMVRLPAVRLWELDATMAMASGIPGLITLAPLMRGATGEMVEQAVQSLARVPDLTKQHELLMACGVFAEPLFSAERFIRLVTKEKLMATDLISYLLQDKMAEVEAELKAREQAKEAELQAREQAKEAELQAKEAELQAKEAELQAREQAKEAELQAREVKLTAALTEEKAALERMVTLLRQIKEIAAPVEQTTLLVQQMVEDTIAVRFPHAPMTLIRQLRKISKPMLLRELHEVALNANDLAEIEGFLPTLSEAA